MKTKGKQSFLTREHLTKLRQYDSTSLVLFEYVMRVLRENVLYMCYIMSIKQETCINVDLFI